MIKIIITIITIGVISYIAWHNHRIQKRIIQNLEEDIKRYKFGIRSAYVKFGKTFEQFAPFTKKFEEGEKERFVFLGCPIDGVIFGEDVIKFVEIKTGNSMLSSKQSKIKRMVEEGKVEFMEVRF